MNLPTGLLARSVHIEIDRKLYDSYSKFKAACDTVRSSKGPAQLETNVMTALHSSILCTSSTMVYVETGILDSVAELAQHRGKWKHVLLQLFATLVWQLTLPRPNTLLLHRLAALCDAMLFAWSSQPRVFNEDIKLLYGTICDITSFIELRWFLCQGRRRKKLCSSICRAMEYTWQAFLNRVFFWTQGCGNFTQYRRPASTCADRHTGPRQSGQKRCRTPTSCLSCAFGFQILCWPGDVGKKNWSPLRRAAGEILGTPAGYCAAVRRWPHQA